MFATITRIELTSAWRSKHQPSDNRRRIAVGSSRSQDSVVCITATNARRNCFEDHQAVLWVSSSAKMHAPRISNGPYNPLGRIHRPQKSPFHKTSCEVKGWRLWNAVVLRRQMLYAAELRAH